MSIEAAPDQDADRTGRESPNGQAGMLWGRSARELHDAYWCSRGVQCIRPGEAGEVDRTADVYLLLDRHQLVLFDIVPMLERIAWRRAALTQLYITNEHRAPYAEYIVMDMDGYVERISRSYDAPGRRSRRVGLTLSPKVAERWMKSAPTREGWKALRRTLAIEQLDRIQAPGRVFDNDDSDEQSGLLRALAETWRSPGHSFIGIEEISEGVWAPRGLRFSDEAAIVGPMWIGFVPPISAGTCLVGPDPLLDVPAVAESGEYPEIRLRSMIEIESDGRHRHASPAVGRGVYPYAKRWFDVIVSLITLIIAAPLFVLIAILICVYDGRPVFYRHRRQTKGGREFGCLKFRTMMNNAEAMAAKFQAMNRCDGPQVFIENDPRVTPIGRVLRKLQLDELPQFWNVLKGDMSIVGPRPSPERENQYCPAWRELRLSVRPGITGLWQLHRTREPGQDFQEWIRYDIQYVREASFWLDIRICAATAWMLLFERRNDANQQTG